MRTDKGTNLKIRSGRAAIQIGKVAKLKVPPYSYVFMATCTPDWRWKKLPGWGLNYAMIKFATERYAVEAFWLYDKVDFKSLVTHLDTLRLHGVEGKPDRWGQNVGLHDDYWTPARGKADAEWIGDAVVEYLPVLPIAPGFLGDTGEEEFPLLINPLKPDRPMQLGFLDEDDEDPELDKEGNS